MNAQRYRATLARYGHSMALKRRDGTSSTFTTCTVTGHARQYKPDELVGGVIQGDRKIHIAQADISDVSWPGPPRKGDILDNSAVQGAEALYWGSDLVGFDVWTRG